MMEEEMMEEEEEMMEEEEETILEGEEEMRRPMPTQGVKNKDCVMSLWSEWSCSVSCGMGERSRSRTVTEEAEGNGKQCGDLDQSGDCELEPCKDKCVTDANCDYGSACNYGICEPLAKKGELCKDDADCMEGLFCLARADPEPEDEDKMLSLGNLIELNMNMNMVRMRSMNSGLAGAPPTCQEVRKCKNRFHCRTDEVCKAGVCEVFTPGKLWTPKPCPEWLDTLQSKIISG